MSACGRAHLDPEPSYCKARIGRCVRLVRCEGPDVVGRLEKVMEGAEGRFWLRVVTDGFGIFAKAESVEVHDVLALYVRDGLATNANRG